MRLWSIHPKYLDTKGLVALWREGLGAQKALLAYNNGEKCGYQNHPQLDRFKKLKGVYPDAMWHKPITDAMLSSIGYYLVKVYEHSKQMGYSFNKNKIIEHEFIDFKIAVAKGQVEYEFQHLLSKLKVRDIARYEKYKHIKNAEDIELHSLFRLIDGDIED